MFLFKIFKCGISAVPVILWKFFLRKDMKINSLQGFNPTKCPPRRSLSIKNKKEAD